MCNQLAIAVEELNETVKYFCDLNLIFFFIVKYCNSVIYICKLIFLVVSTYIHIQFVNRCYQF